MNRRQLICAGLFGALGMSGMSSTTSARTPASGSSEQASLINLHKTWKKEVSNIGTVGEDFVAGYSQIERFSPDGETVFKTREIPDSYYFLIDSGWRNGLYADNTGVYAGARSNDDDRGGRLYAFDPDTGEQRWKYQEPNDGLHTNIRTPIRDGENVIYASMASGSGSDQQPTVRALNVNTGKQQWQIDRPEGFITGLFVYDDRLVVQQTFDVIFYDLSTQKIVEETTFGGGFNRAVQQGTTLYIPGETIRAIDLPSANEIWKTETGREVNTAAVMGEQGVYVGTEAGYILGYDSQSGEQQWETRIEGVVEFPPVAENGVVWVASQRGDLSAFSETTGESLYQENVEPDLEFAIQEGILVDNYREAAFRIQFGSGSNQDQETTNGTDPMDDQPTTTEDENNKQQTTDRENTENRSSNNDNVVVEIPGFGISEVAMGVCGAGYILQQKISNQE